MRWTDPGLRLPQAGGLDMRRAATPAGVLPFAWSAAGSAAHEAFIA